MAALTVRQPHQPTPRPWCLPARGHGAHPCEEVCARPCPVEHVVEHAMASCKLCPPRSVLAAIRRIQSGHSTPRRRSTHTVEEQGGWKNKRKKASQGSSSSRRVDGRVARRASRATVSVSRGGRKPVWISASGARGRRRACGRPWRAHRSLFGWAR